MGMGGPSGSGTSSTPSNSVSQAYQPQAQPQADTNWQSLINPLVDQALGGINAIGANPYGAYYPSAQNELSTYFTGTTGTPQSGLDAINASQAAASAGPGLFSQGLAGQQALGGSSMMAIPYLQQALGQGFDPMYQGIVGGVASNPYAGQRIAGAQQAAQIGGQGAGALGGSAGSLLGTSGRILESGFDPRSQLYSRTLNNTLDQQNAINAMSGLGSSPYGAGLTGDALRNFNIDWQDKQLGRQESAATQVGKNLFAAGPALSGASNLAQTSAAAPSNAYLEQFSDLGKALSARNIGASQGIGAYGNLLSSAGSGLGQAQNLGYTGATQLNALGALPYQTGIGIGNNALQGMTNVANFGNQAYALPQTVQGDLGNYMDLGRQASLASGNLGQLGFNQASQGLGGMLSGANTLLGSSGPFSSGGALGGLFGGGGGSSIVGDFGGGGAALGVADELGGVGEAASGGGSFLSSALPFAMSG